MADAGSVLGDFGKVEDCNAYDRRTKPQAGLRALVTLTSPSVELQASAHSACVSAPISNVKGGQVLELRVSGRTVIGQPSRVCLFAVGPNRCVPLPNPTTNAGWMTIDSLVRLPPNTKSAKLYLYADASLRSSTGDQKDLSRRTVTQYRQLRVRRLNVIATKTVKASPPSTTTIRLPAGKHDLRTSVDIPRPELKGWGPVEDCNRLDNRSKPEVGISAEKLAGLDQDPTDFTGIVLRAKAHAACVSSSVSGMKGRASYELRLSYRTLAGATPPRVCLLDPTTNRCVKMRPLRGTPKQLQSNPNWTTVRYAVSIREFGQSSAQPKVYLYADTTAGRSELAYTDVALTPIADESVTVVATGKTSFDLPEFSWAQHGPARYSVDVQDTRDPFVLALSDSWSPEWRVRGLPKDATVTQMKIDGYRNGWLIDADGDLKLSIEYVPARWGRLAISISLTTVGVTAIVAVIAPWWRRRKTEYVPLSIPLN